MAWRTLRIIQDFQVFTEDPDWAGDQEAPPENARAQLPTRRNGSAPTEGFSFKLLLLDSNGNLLGDTTMTYDFQFVEVDTFVLDEVELKSVGGGDEEFSAHSGEQYSPGGIGGSDFEGAISIRITNIQNKPDAAEKAIVRFRGL